MLYIYLPVSSWGQSRVNCWHVSPIHIQSAENDPSCRCCWGILWAYSIFFPLDKTGKEVKWLQDCICHFCPNVGWEPRQACRCSEGGRSWDTFGWKRTQLIRMKNGSFFVHNSMDFPEEFATWKVKFVENHGYLVTQRWKVIMGLACTGATNTWLHQHWERGQTVAVSW